MGGKQRGGREGEGDGRREIDKQRVGSKGQRRGGRGEKQNREYRWRARDERRMRRGEQEDGRDAETETKQGESVGEGWRTEGEEAEVIRQTKEK